MQSHLLTKREIFSHFLNIPVESKLSSPPLSPLLMKILHYCRRNCLSAAPIFSVLLTIISNFQKLCNLQRETDLLPSKIAIYSELEGHQLWVISGIGEGVVAGCLLQLEGYRFMLQAYSTISSKCKVPRHMPKECPGPAYYTCGKPWHNAQEFPENPVAAYLFFRLVTQSYTHSHYAQGCGQLTQSI